MPQLGGQSWGFAKRSCPNQLKAGNWKASAAILPTRNFFKFARRNLATTWRFTSCIGLQTWPEPKHPLSPAARSSCWSFHCILGAKFSCNRKLQFVIILLGTESTVSNHVTCSCKHLVWCYSFSSSAPALPRHVLSSFIDSFQVVWKLGPRTETEVLEDYLKWRWGTMPSNLGPCPSGAGSVAKMRLVLMAQGDSLEILRQFRQQISQQAKCGLHLPFLHIFAILLSFCCHLPGFCPSLMPTFLARTGGIQTAHFSAQKHLQELAITGCPGQHFLCDDLRESRGPALLVYYAPALMQKAGRKDPLGALRPEISIYTRQWNTPKFWCWSVEALNGFCAFKEPPEDSSRSPATSKNFVAFKWDGRRKDGPGAHRYSEGARSCRHSWTTHRPMAAIR